MNWKLVIVAVVVLSLAGIVLWLAGRPAMYQDQEGRLHIRSGFLGLSDKTP